MQKKLEHTVLDNSDFIPRALPNMATQVTHYYNIDVHVQCSYQTVKTMDQEDNQGCLLFERKLLNEKKINNISQTSKLIIL